MVLDSQLQKNKSDLYACVSMASRSSIQLLSLIALSYSFKHATIADRSDSRRVSSIAMKTRGTIPSGAVTTTREIADVL